MCGVSGGWRRSCARRLPPPAAPRRPTSPPPQLHPLFWDISHNIVTFVGILMAVDSEGGGGVERRGWWWRKWWCSGRCCRADQCLQEEKLSSAPRHQPAITSGAHSKRSCALQHAPRHPPSPPPSRMLSHLHSVLRSPSLFRTQASSSHLHQESLRQSVLIVGDGMRLTTAVMSHDRSPCNTSRCGFACL